MNIHQQRIAVILPLLLLLGTGLSRPCQCDEEPTGPERHPLDLSASDDVVRLGSIYSLRISRTVTGDEYASGPWQIQALLDQDGQQIGFREFTLAHLGQLRAGIQINLVANAPAPSPLPVDVRVVINDGQRRVQSAQIRVVTPQGLQAELQKVHQRLIDSHPPAQDVLPFLWAEEAQDLFSGDISLHSCAQVRELSAQIAGWLGGRRPLLDRNHATELAVRDSVDGSVQPYRISLPSLPATGPVASVQVVLVCGEYGPDLTRLQWPLLPSLWAQGARASATIALVEAYPAGDARWRAVAARRARLVLDEALARYPEQLTQRAILLGVGAGAAGAIALAEETPQEFAALLLIKPRLGAPADAQSTLLLPDSPAQEATASRAAQRWLARRQPGNRPSNLNGLQVAVWGQGDAESMAWFQSLGKSKQHQLNDEAVMDQSFWLELLNHLDRASSAHPRDLEVLAPGDQAGCLVEEMARWGTPGILHFTYPPAAGAHVRGEGIGHMTSQRPDLIIDGCTGLAPMQSPLAEQSPAKVAGQAQGPLDAYASAPFVIVVGSGENAAAAADNNALAEAFLGQWARHAQGRPPIFLDKDFPAARFSHHNLVLIGTSRSNGVLYDLVKDDPLFPLRWSPRELIYKGRHFLREDHRAVALAWPHPAHDGRLMIILDGKPGWPLPGGSDDLPLSGLPDLVIGGDGPSASLAVWTLFDNHWH